MHLIHIVSGRSSLDPVFRYSSPYLILYHEHSDLFELLSQILDVITYKAVRKLHIGPVVEHIQGTRHIDFKCCCHMLCLRLFLCKKCLVQVSQDWHILRSRIFKIFLIDLPDTAVNDRLFYRTQTILVPNDQLT